MNAAERGAYRLVAVRSDGICEACGHAAAIQMHHRKYRSRGGDTTTENVLHVCLNCHRAAETEQGHVDGWSVHRWDDPSDVAVFYRGEWRFLTAWGSAVRVGEVHHAP